MFEMKFTKILPIAFLNLGFGGHLAISMEENPNSYSQQRAAQSVNLQEAETLRASADSLIGEGTVNRAQILEEEQRQDEAAYVRFVASIQGHVLPQQSLSFLMTLDDQVLFSKYFADILKNPRIVEGIYAENNEELLRSLRHKARQLLEMATKSRETSEIVAIINAVDLKLGKKNFGYLNVSN